MPQSLRCLLSRGPVADVTHAQALIEGFEADAVLADKAYDANHVLEYLAQRNIRTLHKPQTCRLNPNSTCFAHLN